MSEYGALPFWRRLGRSRARHELACAEHLARHGVATPRPLAVGELRNGWLLERSFELIPWLDDAIDLGRALAEHRTGARDRRAVASAFGSLVRQIHDAGLDQDDLAPNNFLWRPDAAAPLLAVDFERARVRSRVSDRARRAALAKLHRYCGTASAADRLRFARAYAGGDRAATRGLWRGVERAARQILAHDVRRWHRAATRSGRRFEPIAFDLSGERASGVARPGVASDSLRAAWAEPGRGGWIVRRLETRTARGGRRVLALALALAQRGLGPRPDAMLVTVEGAHLVFERPAGATALAERSVQDPEPALGVLLDRLLSLGAIATPIGRDGFAISDDAQRAWLLDPECLDLAGEISDRRAARRAIVALLALARRG